MIADAGNASAAVARDLELGAGAGFSMALGMGGMGYSIGAALGAALATRSPAIALAGDGAFFMHGFEIHSALEADAPVLFVIFNNNAHAMCVTRDQIYLGIEKSISRFKACPIAGGLSAMFPSLRTYEARTVSELRAAVESLQGFDRPSALVIELDADEIPPFLPFQDALPSARRA